MNPGVTEPQPVPSCPTDLFIGDMGIIIVPFHCGSGRWECVTQFDRRCGVHPFLDAWWDDDYSGALETFPVTRPYIYDPIAGTFAVFGAPGSFLPSECGLRSGLPVRYGPPTPTDCQPPRSVSSDPCPVFDSWCGAPNARDADALTRSMHMLDVFSFGVAQRFVGSRTR